MIAALLKDEALLADMRAAPRDRLCAWWLGQSGFMLAWKGEYALIDPYLSDSLTRKYANTGKPHVRMTEIPIAPVRLDFVRVVTSSHNHTDHLDAETLKPLLQASPSLTLIASEANRAFAAERLGVPALRISGITLHGPNMTPPFTFYAVPAAHNAIEQDARGHHKFIGLIIEAGPYVIYHSGDTLRYDGMEAYLQRWRIDLALLPINGNDASRGVAGNLNAGEAAALAKAIGAGLAVPCHYDMFTFNTAPPAEFEQACARLAQPCRVLRCGERLML